MKKILQYEPFINRQGIAKELLKYSLSKYYFTEYKKTRLFEKKIAKFLNVKHCFATNNGTISLVIALLAIGIKPGDLILVPDLTMIATANAARLIGAELIFVDIDPRNLCLDLNKAKNFIRLASCEDCAKKEVKAVIYVSLNGRKHPKEEYDNFLRFCQYNNVAIIEDNAQSFGSKINKTYISCPLGGIGSFSFSVPKIITTGQGGALVTNRDDLADKIKTLKDHGRLTGGHDNYDYFGINSKFTDLQAIVGINQLKTIEYRVIRKKRIFYLYRKSLSGINEIKFIETDLYNTTPWFVDIYVENRDELQEYLLKRNIQTRKIYAPIHTQKAYEDYNNCKILITEKYCSMGLWLPSSINLSDEQIMKICKIIKQFYKRKR